MVSAIIAWKRAANKEFVRRIRPLPFALATCRLRGIHDYGGQDDAFADDLFSALQHLRYNKHEIILFHVVDKSKELEFEFENRPYQFIDMESGEKVKLHSNEVKAFYVEQMTKFERELKLRCGQYKIDFVEADINLDFRQVLLPFLMKRTKMI